MNKRRNTFLEYRIYRKKFLSTVLVVLLLSIFVFCAMLLFFLNLWVNDFRQQAQNSFLDSERRMSNIQVWAQEYANSIYGNKQLLADTTALFAAKDQQAYLQAREYNSLNSPEMILSLPTNMRQLFVSNRMMISGVTLESESGTKAIWFDNVSGDIKVEFNVADARTDRRLGEPGSFGDLVVTSVQIRDPWHLDLTLGTMHFWIKCKDVYEEGRRLDTVWAAVNREGVLLGGNKISNLTQEWLKEAALQGKQSGWLENKGIDPVFFVKYSSNQCDYAFVAVKDVGTIMEENRYVLSALFSAFILIALGVLCSSYIGIQKDANFLKDIMKMLSGMEGGDFEQVSKVQLPIKDQENEYGMIAVALKDVGMKLKGYIETEYILKLKEQETEMRALQHQINPHFLYNTLETLRSKALEGGDPDTADAIALLGALYRARMHKQESISLKEEFELLKMYLQIMALRFGDNFVYQVELDEEVEDIPTVNFWLQPLAENFFTHGFDRESIYNLLLVNGYAENGGVRVDIIDNGSGIRPDLLEEVRRNMYEGNDDPEADIGLRNVYMRLNYYYRDGFSMEINNNVEGGFKISIFIPGKAGEDVHFSDRRR